MSAQARPFAEEVGDPKLSVAEFRRVAAMLAQAAGIDLEEGKDAFVHARLIKRLRELRLSSFDDYCSLVDADRSGEEGRRMVEALTTNYTFFFREPHHFDHLRDEVMPRLAQKAKRGERVRLWSAGCSLGHEPYSMGLTVLDVLPDAERYDVKILATDIDRQVIASASAGLYDDQCLAPVPADARARHFLPAGGDSRANDRLRALVSFRQLNLLEDWPMSGAFDVIFCRNVTIYFAAPTREQLWTRLARKLTPDGILYAGHSERITGAALSALAHVGSVATTYARLQR